MADPAAPAEKQAASLQQSAGEAQTGGAGAGADPASGGGAGQAAEPAGGSGEQSPRKRALDASSDEPSISLKVVFGRQAVTTQRPAASTVAELKADIAAHTGAAGQAEEGAEGAGGWQLVGSSTAHSRAWRVPCRPPPAHVLITAAALTPPGVPVENQKLLFKGQVRGRVRRGAAAAH